MKTPPGHGYPGLQMWAAVRRWKSPAPPTLAGAQQDIVNQQSWSDSGAMNWLASLQGFTDEGERAAYWRIADEVRNQPILDLGVGAGRTITFLRSLSADYVAIDYLAPMVELARHKFPFVNIRVGDDLRDVGCFNILARKTAPD